MDTERKEDTMDFKLESKAFGYGEPIPVKYTCKGENISPPFSWTTPPAGTKSLILIVDDPDAPHGWVHWVFYNINPKKTSLEENCPKVYELGNDSCQGMTDFREIGYGGPCPPSGTHRYFFRLYAVDLMLRGHLNMTKEDLMSQIRGHILATAEYMGTFSA